MKNLINHILAGLFAVCAFLSLDGCSKDQNFEKIIQNGDIVLSPSLSNQNVNVFMEDSDGYMWIGTDVGLNRFDGESYVQFLSSPSDSMSLIHSKVYSIYQDSKGDIWAGTRMGINRLRSDLKWDHFKMNAISTNIFDIYENSKGEIFAGNRWSLLKQDPDSLVFNEVMNFIVYDNLYSKTCLDSNDDVWLVQDFQIAQYNGTTFEKIRTMAVDDRIIGSLMDNNDRLWLISRNKVRIFDTRRFVFERVPSALSQDSKMLRDGLKSLYRTTNGIVFIGQDDVMYFYNFNKETVQPRGTHNIISTFYNDSKGNSWIGYANKGYIIKNNTNNLTEGEALLQGILKGTSINKIDKGHDGNLWVLSDEVNIFILDTKSDKSRQLDVSSLFPGSMRSKNIITSIEADKLVDNCLWVLSGNKIFRCMLSGNSLKVNATYSVDTNLMSGLFQDSKGRVFVYGQGLHIFYINPGSAKIETIQASEIRLTQVTDMLETASGDIIFCCNYRNIFKVNFESSDAPQLIDINYSNYEPTCMTMDSEGRVWVSANGSKIKRFVPGSMEFEIVDFDASLYNNSIIEDGDYMWIGSQNGLYRYEKKTGKYNVYYAGDVIIGNQFSTHSVCKLDDGKLVFGGSDGITIFDPKNNPVIGEDISLDIGFVQTGDELYFHKKANVSSNRLVLNYKNNDLNIHYSANNYDDFLHLRYEYKMDGVDNDWHYVHASRDAHYANLPYGKNVFRVRVVGPGRVQTGIESSAEIVIRRPALISTVAKFIYALLFALLVFLFYRMLHHNREKDLEAELSNREKEQQILLNEKNVDYFTSISHEFRTPLTMILGAADSMVHSENKHDAMEQYSKILYRNVRRMQKLVDQLLDVSKLENGSLKLSARLMNILPKAKDIVDAFRFSTKAKGIDVIFECNEDTIIGYLDEDAFEKIMYNLISNAVKYTPQGGSITIKVDVVNYDKAVDKFRVATDDRYVRFKVIDTGVGIPEDKRDVIFNKYYQVQSNKSIGGTGIGLYFTKMLVNLHHGDVVCEASLDKDGNVISGTQFTFILPLNEKSYTKEEITEQAPAAIKANPSVLSEFVEMSPALDPEESDKPTILAIDDDPEVLHYIKSLLSPYYKMVLRFDATTGYEAIGQFSPDVIISDVLMLDVDGFEFCRMVKDNAEYSHIPVILLTAKTATEDQIKGVEAHADAYVTKPFEPDFLKALVKSMLEKKAEAMKVLSASTISTREKLEEVLKEKDREFIESVYKFMEAELENEELNVTAIYEQMYMSRTKFYNKMKSLTGETPGNFFRTYKLNRAKELLETGEYKIAAVAVMTGFCSASHFSTLFKKQFGITPTEFLSGKPIQ